MSMWQRWLGIDFARRNLLKQAKPGPMQAYLTHPFPSARTPCDEAELLALDLETTGLNPSKDHILSVGCVVVSRLSIPLACAAQRYVRQASAIPESSAVIHRITDDIAACGDDLPQVLAWLLSQLRGRVLLAHHAQIEQRFLDTACRAQFGTPFLAPTIDTLRLAHRRFTRRNDVFQSNELRLFNLRQRYHLPPMMAHNALNDALACAELLLVLAAESGSKCQLGDLGMY